MAGIGIINNNNDDHSYYYNNNNRHLPASVFLFVVFFVSVGHDLFVLMFLVANDERASVKGFDHLELVS